MKDEKMRKFMENVLKKGEELGLDPDLLTTIMAEAYGEQYMGERKEIDDREVLEVRMPSLLYGPPLKEEVTEYVVEQPPECLYGPPTPSEVVTEYIEAPRLLYGPPSSFDVFEVSNEDEDIKKGSSR